MGKHKKNKSASSKQKGLTRVERLDAAQHWISKYLVKGYSKQFGVGKQKTVKELETLGYSISNEYKNRLKEAEIQRKNKVKKRKVAKEQEEFAEDSDGTFAFIAGYTSGGAPYGITWEEWEQQEEENTQCQKSTANQEFDIDDEDLPF